MSELFWGVFASLRRHGQHPTGGEAAGKTWGACMAELEAMCDSSELAQEADKGEGQEEAEGPAERPNESAKRGPILALSPDQVRRLGLQKPIGRCGVWARGRARREGRLVGAQRNPYPKRLALQ